MKKIFLIIKREYLSRVKKKSFLIITFLVPLLFLGMWGGVIALSIQDSGSSSTVYVIDNSNLIINDLKDTESLSFEKATRSANEEKSYLQENQFLLVIPENILESQKLDLLSSQKASIFVQGEISNQVDNILRKILLNNAGIDIQTLDSIQPKVKVTSLEITEQGEQESNAGVAMGIGMFASIMIYLTLFIYGAQVMRGVIEEKNNRVVEIIISSVKPFQLMLGKIVGIGLVGLTQFLLWIVLSGTLLTVGGLIMASQMPDAFSPEELSSISSSVPNSAAFAQQNSLLGDVQGTLAGIDFPYLISCFLIFFIGGYLLYSALFAAVGSAVDNETETQQFMLPITMPLLFTYVMSFGVLIKDPHGPLAFWLSMIPFTSPIAMMVRVPFGVPLWQLSLSIILLIAGFILTTWVASRIYRVGILMYGKKASYKELIKWFNYRK
ncbi:ABC transporter permease [Albibacterium bauzanense]|uniref:ABC-2 type transport system permease protein n=1 Tax=Albibacterium bauzanense TaxID=653929 RepID=A0A4V2PY81_9SPHI|nr:ABC transporter permease [Albibacterium bauzanense]TCK84981.1 ABC-2 type transport system permease protein [Albibacterium bauzanense]